MASSSVLGSFTDIPEDFSLTYLKSVISLRKKQKAHAFIAGSYVESIKIYREDAGFVSVIGEVYPSQRKNNARHVVNIQISVSEKLISDAYCKCQQGDDGTCSHVVAVILLLESWKIAGYKEVPSMAASTSLPQQWDKPRGQKIAAEPVSQMVISRPTNVLRKRKPVVADYQDNRKIKVQRSDIQQLLNLKTSSISYLVDTDESTPVTTPFGQCAVGSALSYQGPLIQLIPKPRDFTGCGDIKFPQSADLDQDCINMLTEHGANWSDLNLTTEEAFSLEKSTRAQNESKNWHTERKKRITASLFGTIVKRKKDINESFLNNTFNAKPFQSKPTSYGQVNEKKAKALYIKKTGAHLHDIGLTVNPDFPFLGASPDGVLCKDGVSGLLEVKCPYLARDMTVNEACTKVKDFCISKEGENLSLKRTHSYYFQVQGQLLVTGAKFCEFVVFTKPDLFIERIFPDKEVMSALLKKLVHTYISHFKPFVLKQNKDN